MVPTVLSAKSNYIVETTHAFCERGVKWTKQKLLPGVFVGEIHYLDPVSTALCHPPHFTPTLGFTSSLFPMSDEPSSKRPLDQESPSKDLSTRIGQKRMRSDVDCYLEHARATSNSLLQTNKEDSSFGTLELTEATLNPIITSVPHLGRAEMGTQLMARIGNTQVSIVLLIKESCNPHELILLGIRNSLSHLQL